MVQMQRVETAPHFSGQLLGWRQSPGGPSHQQLLLDHGQPLASPPAVTGPRRWTGSPFA